MTVSTDTELTDWLESLPPAPVLKPLSPKTAPTWDQTKARFKYDLALRDYAKAINA